MLDVLFFFLKNAKLLAFIVSAHEPLHYASIYCLLSSFDPSLFCTYSSFSVVFLYVMAILLKE